MKIKNVAGTGRSYATNAANAANMAAFSKQKQRAFLRHGFRFIL